MFNSFSTLPYIPYNIIVHLAKNDEVIWKMLKYNSYDAMSKPNLSMKEKIDLIWKQGKDEDYGIFLKPLVEDAITQSKSIMKCYQYYINPSNLYIGAVTFAFDFLYGGDMALVEYNGVPVSRGDLFIHRLLTVLNGADVGGVGKLVFHEDISRYHNANATIGNSKTFAGVQIFMTVQTGDSGTQEDCDDRY